MKRLVGALAMCLLLTSCAQAAKPALVHIDSTMNQPEHDEAVYPTGEVMDIYPDRANPREVIFHKANGGQLDATCLNSDCSNMHLRISGSNVVPDGAYQLLETDDPKLVMIRDGDDTRTIGYLATNSGGMQFFPDLQQAQTYEHQGETARAVGKVVAGAVLISALIVLEGAAAAADARANAVSTRCTTVGKSTTCTSY